MLRRRLMQSGIPDGFVDLGLPSGTLWAKGNICKDANGKYYIGEETDYGCYFSWGNIEGHNMGDGYNFDNTYYNTAGSSLTSDIAPDDASHDAALACLGSPWHMPTSAIFYELYRNTDRLKTTIDGVTGWKFMKKTDHSVYIFFPAAGSWSYTLIDARNEYCYYWASTLYNNSSANGMSSSRYSLDFSSSWRTIGQSIRAVIGPQDWIEKSYEDSFSVKFYNSVQDSYYGDSGSTTYDYSDISCNMEIDALIQRVDEYYSGKKEYTTLNNISVTATTMDIYAKVNIHDSYCYVDGYMRLYNSDLIIDGFVDFRITSERQDYDGGDLTYYFNLENDNGDVVGSGSCFFLEDGYAGIEITPN